MKITPCICDVLHCSRKWWCENFDLSVCLDEYVTACAKNNNQLVDLMKPSGSTGKLSIQQLTTVGDFYPLYKDALVDFHS
jgi:hypothetical protein